MSKREFTKVSPNLWRSPRFRKLENTDAQLLYLYFLTCSHQNSMGCFRLPDGYACSDIGWSQDRYVAARGALVGSNMILYSEDDETLYVLRWFRHSPPMNDKHSLGVQSMIAGIESDKIRETVEAEFAEAETARLQKFAADETAKRLQTGRIR